MQWKICVEFVCTRAYFYGSFTKIYVYNCLFNAHDFFFFFVGPNRFSPFQLKIVQLYMMQNSKIKPYSNTDTNKIILLAISNLDACKNRSTRHSPSHSHKCKSWNKLPKSLAMQRTWEAEVHASARLETGRAGEWEGVLFWRKSCGRFSLPSFGKSTSSSQVSRFSLLWTTKRSTSIPCEPR